MENEESTDIKWSPKLALEKVNEEIDSYGVPSFTPKTDEVAIDFNDIMNSSDVDLQHLLMFHGGWKAFLEMKLAGIESVLGIIQSNFDENYSTALFKISQECEQEDRRKPTRDEYRGLILNKYKTLSNSVKNIIERKALHKKVAGSLAMHTSLYNTTSRIISLRTANNQS
tara:strand:- start:3504 stop:4013 length:510 start_codon:yes stop_codon:yes gene_type:complete